MTDQFLVWWTALSIAQQESVDDRVQLLARSGPVLGRPIVDLISTSRHHNMKELRASLDGALRVLFVFDPRRFVILLLGGDKSGNWRGWYEAAIPAADALYDDHLEELREEGLI